MANLSSQPRTCETKPLREIAELLALGYLRHRKRLAHAQARESSSRPENPLDDVAPRGRVRTPENRTPENGGRR